MTDYTNASRTMLFDIHNLCWDKDILDWFGIPSVMLPEVKPSSCVYGYTDDKFCPERWRLPERQATSRRLCSVSAVLMWEM